MLYLSMNLKTIACSLLFVLACVAVGAQARPALVFSAELTPEACLAYSPKAGLTWQAGGLCRLGAEAAITGRCALNADMGFRWLSPSSLSASGVGVRGFGSALLRLGFALYLPDERSRLEASAGLGVSNYLGTSLVVLMPEMNVAYRANLFAISGSGFFSGERFSGELYLPLGLRLSADSVGLSLGCGLKLYEARAPRVSQDAVK
jgi:hypothetical protein